MTTVHLRTVPSDADSDDVRLYDPTLADAGGVINATFAVTIDAVTLAAEADLLVQATANQTLDPVTLNATGALIIQGTLGQTIDAVTLVATGGLVGSEAPVDRGDVDFRGTSRRRPLRVYEEQEDDEPVAKPPRKKKKTEAPRKKAEKAINLPAIAGTADLTIGPVTLAATFIVEPGAKARAAAILNQAIEDDEEELIVLLLAA